eukprot:TRINITY_DN10833_c0_g1_i4.p1 TRINITY_DN10833_c0_g1~~TRINITY_DN10833_c0_g1_i4.p1  ORF type:complete len:147 (-),score=24.72 TRINITY_DN10833_c0_g1_i4:137-577(-)
MLRCTQLAARQLRARHLATKPGIATIEVLSTLKATLVLDVRDPNEVAAGKGGPPAAIKGSVNCPLNIDGVGQRERPTSVDEFLLSLKENGVELPQDLGAPIVTHCGGGGRGGRAAALLRDLGFLNVHNGGGPRHIASAFASREDSS